MLSLPTETWTTVFTAAFTGIYTFVVKGPTGPSFRILDGTGTRYIAPREVVDDYGGNTGPQQKEFTIELESGDELQHDGGPCSLYGVRIGDEL